jgi:hypothetical protein
MDVEDDGDQNIGRVRNEEEENEEEGGYINEKEQNGSIHAHDMSKDSNYNDITQSQHTAATALGMLSAWGQT